MAFTGCTINISWEILGSDYAKLWVSIADYRDKSRKNCPCKGGFIKVSMEDSVILQVYVSCSVLYTQLLAS